MNFASKALKRMLKSEGKTVNVAPQQPQEKKQIPKMTVEGVHIINPCPAEVKGQERERERERERREEKLAARISVKHGTAQQL